MLVAGRLKRSAAASGAPHIVVVPHRHRPLPEARFPRRRKSNCPRSLQSVDPIAAPQVRIAPAAKSKCASRQRADDGATHCRRADCTRKRCRNRPHALLKPQEGRGCPAQAANAGTLAGDRVPPGASGRMVRIGTFSIAAPGEERLVVRWFAHYPAMRHLPAVVRPVLRNANGKTYYRLQIGTTSQAHSEILCQRMRMIASKLRRRRPAEEAKE